MLPLKNGEINAEWTYAELYDADGMLVGLRLLAFNRLQAARRAFAA